MKTLIADIRERYEAMKAIPRGADRREAADRISEASDRALAAFAKLNGWRRTGTWFSLRSMIPNSRKDPFDEVYGSDPGEECIDHTIRFLERRRPVGFISQPYITGTSESQHIESALRLAERYGLAVHVPPDPLASFYYPGRCMVLGFTAPGRAVRWLPEQCRSRNEDGPLPASSALPARHNLE